MERQAWQCMQSRFGPVGEESQDQLRYPLLDHRKLKDVLGTNYGEA